MLKRMAVLTVLAVGVSVAGVVGSPTAWAQTTCTGLIRNTTVQGNIVVPERARCTITGTNVVGGSIYVSPGGSLTLVNSSVDGSIVASQPEQLILENATVTGSVIVSGLTPFTVIGICESRIGDNLVIENGVTEGFIVVGPSCDPEGGNEIGGNVLLQNLVTNQDPEFPFPPLRVANNVIGGRLYCFNNSPPAVAENNVAHGGAFGECAPGAAA